MNSNGKKKRKRNDGKRLVAFVATNSETGEEELMFRYIYSKRKRKQPIKSPKIIVETEDGKQVEEPYM